MEKKSFVILVMSVIGGMLFSLGMCMCLLPEWEMFSQGIVLGIIGFVELLITYFVYRKMTGKAPIKLSFKVIANTMYGLISTAVFGFGLALVMAYGKMVHGMIVGIVGIVMLLFLIPMCIGFKDSGK